MSDDEPTEFKTEIPLSNQPERAADSLDSSGLPSREPVDSLPPGSVLFGSYEIEERLGVGGMGEVYRARHLSLPEYRAVKMMNPTLASDQSAVSHFHREARTLLEVAHPAIVRCHDFLQDEHGRFFLIMELVEGISLAERLQNGPLSIPEVRALGARLAGGLAECHANGVIHRDIAPDNIMLPEGRIELAKLIDFGIAKRLQPGEESAVFGWKGKLRFASPEQFGFFGGVIDQRSDYYSFGLALCCAAGVDFGELGENFHDAVESRRTLPSLSSRIPRAIRDELAPLLAFDPDDRPDTLDSFFVDIEGGAGTRIPDRRFSGETSRLRSLLGLSGAAALVAIVAFFVWNQMGHVEPKPTALPEALPPPAPDAAPNSFWALRAELEKLSGRPNSSSSLEIDPNPVADGGSYDLRISADCDCYAMIFLLDAEEARIDLLYPNEFDAPKRLIASQPFQVPTNSVYEFEAIASSGADRIKLLLLPEPADLAPAGTSWGVEEGEKRRIEELAFFLDDLAGKDPNTWSSAEADLRIRP